MPLAHDWFCQVPGNNYRELDISADRAIAALAEAQHNVVARRQLIAIGLDDDAVEYRVKIGRLHRVHRGVYAVGSPKLTQAGEFMAAVLAVEGSVLSHLSAVIHYGMLRPQPGPVHVTARERHALRDGIRPHHTTRPDEGTYDGVPITSPARAILDLAGMRGVPDHWVQRAINQALVEELVTLDELFSQADTMRKGAKRLSRLLRAAAPARSRLEDETVAALRAAGLPSFDANTRLHGEEVDLYFPTLNLVIEIDSERYHGNPFAQAYDRRKTARLEAKGLRVVRARTVSEARNAGTRARPRR